MNSAIDSIILWSGIIGVAFLAFGGWFAWLGEDSLNVPHFGLASWLTIGGANLAILAYLNCVKMFMQGKIKNTLGESQESLGFRLSLLGIPECLMLLSSFCLI